MSDETTNNSDTSFTVHLLHFESNLPLGANAVYWGPCSMTATSCLELEGCGGKLL